MRKDKNKKLEAPGNAFVRMNYLYQASHMVSELHTPNPLSNFYNRVIKEISKKVVEKLHTDLKRTMCRSCNNLVSGNDQIWVKIKSNSKKKRRRNSCDLKVKKFSQNFISNQQKTYKYCKSQKEAKNKKPNKLWWTCFKCGFSKGYVQEPLYKLWVHQGIDNS